MRGPVREAATRRTHTRVPHGAAITRADAAPLDHQRPAPQHRLQQSAELLNARSARSITLGCC